MTFFFLVLVLTCFWAENWTSADMMTLKKPVLLLRSENMVTLMLSLARRSLEIGQVVHGLTQQAKQIEQYWQSVLKRLMKVQTFLCRRGLALRGDNDVIGSVRNGNYQGILELLSEYDDFLKQHLQKHASGGSGHTNYLSSTICKELVQQMGEKVMDETIFCIKN